MISKLTVYKKSGLVSRINVDVLRNRYAEEVTE